MPFVPRLSGVLGRFYARIDYFQCACPSCGRLLLPGRTRQERRQFAYRSTGGHFNPHLQLLKCLHCGASFVVGLLAFQVPKSRRHPKDAPLDARPTREERLELERLGSGYLMKGRYQDGETEVNRAVEAPCSCQWKSWDPACPVHGAETANS